MITSIVEFAVKQLVEQPQSVSVTQLEQNGKTIVEIKVAAQDLKRIIGKEGRVVRAIRTMVNNLGQAGDKEVILDIAE